MARSGRDCNLDDQREPVRPALPERSSHDGTADRSRSGATTGAGHSQLPAAADLRGPEAARAASPRQPYREPDRDRPYSLRDSELGTLVEVATFRAVTLDDLTLYRYGGDGTQARADLDNLDRQGLIRSRTAYPERTVYLTLTRQGHRFVERHRPHGLHTRQVLYHGFVKPREAKHDATLYRLYHHQAERIQAQGGNIQRVVLDFELKKALNRELSKLSFLPESTRAQQKNELARQHGLKVVSGRIPVPDLQIEYETADREQARVNLELATAHYHRDGLAAKARAGFAMYALSEDAPSLHRALQDSGLMEEILSL
jgi:hypothetical protein